MQTYQLWLDDSSFAIFLAGEQCKTIQNTFSNFLLGATNIFVKWTDNINFFIKEALVRDMGKWPSNFLHFMIPLFLLHFPISQISLMCKFIISLGFQVPAARFPYMLVACHYLLPRSNGLTLVFKAFSSSLRPDKGMTRQWIIEQKPLPRKY